MPIKDELTKLSPYFYRRPPNPYPEKRYPRFVNDFTAHVAGFEDAQNPYSFGASPGSFSLNIPAGSNIASTLVPHFLSMAQNNSASGYNYVRWINATGVNVVWALLYPFTYAYSSGVYYMAEMRFWGVASPGASDPYFSLRFANQAGTETKVRGYYGTGITFNVVGDGTGVDNWSPFPRKPLLVRCYASGTTAQVSMYDPQFTVRFLETFTTSGGFSNIKFWGIYLMPNTYAGINIDWIKAGGSTVTP